MFRDAPRGAAALPDFGRSEGAARQRRITTCPPGFLTLGASLHLHTKLYLIFSFINNYGTHYISSATIGSLYGEQSLLSRESYFEMVTKGIDVELYAGFSAIGSINPSFDYNQTESETFKKVQSI